MNFEIIQLWMQDIPRTVKMKQNLNCWTFVIFTYQFSFRHQSGLTENKKCLITVTVAFTPGAYIYITNYVVRSRLSYTNTRENVSAIPWSFFDCRGNSSASTLNHRCLSMERQLKHVSLVEACNILSMSGLCVVCLRCSVSMSCPRVRMFNGFHCIKFNHSVEYGTKQ